MLDARTLSRTPEGRVPVCIGMYALNLAIVALLVRAFQLTDTEVGRFLVQHYKSVLGRPYSVTADLLKQGVGTLTEIAYQDGFSSQPYFSNGKMEHLFSNGPGFRALCNNDETLLSLKL